MSTFSFVKLDTHVLSPVFPVPGFKVCDSEQCLCFRDRERRRHYRILQSVQLSSACPQLTKIVRLLPNLIVYNRSKRPLRFMEDNERADLWIDLAVDKCQPFWPVTDSMRMLVKFRDSKLVSQHFPVTQTHTTVLRMDRGVSGTVACACARPGRGPAHVSAQQCHET